MMLKFFNTISRSSARGFTLIEMVMVIFILSILLLTFSGMYTQYQREKGRKVTEENIKAVMVELESYQARNGQYICPASLTLPRTDVNYGRRKDFDILDPNVITCQLAAPLNAAGGFGGGFGRQDGRNNRPVIIGAIPFRDLNLRESQSYDGYGSRLYYAVSYDLTSKVTYRENEGAISVIDAAGTQLAGRRDVAATEGTAKYVVFSVGPNRRGGYSRQGIRSVDCAPIVILGLETLERENCDITTGAAPARFRWAARRDADVVINQMDDILAADFSLNFAGAGGWRRGDTTADATENNDDLLLPNRHLIVGTLENRPQNAALQILGPSTMPAPQLRVGQGAGAGGEIKVNQICNIDPAGNPERCFNIFDMERNCPIGQFVTGIGWDIALNRPSVFCDRIYYGCYPTGPTINDEKVLTGRAPDGSPKCIDYAATPDPVEPPGAGGPGACFPPGPNCIAGGAGNPANCAPRDDADSYECTVANFNNNLITQPPPPASLVNLVTKPGTNYTQRKRYNCLADPPRWSLTGNNIVEACCNLEGTHPRFRRISCPNVNPAGRPSSQIHPECGTNNITYHSTFADALANANPVGPNLAVSPSASEMTAIVRSNYAPLGGTHRAIPGASAPANGTDSSAGCGSAAGGIGTAPADNFVVIQELYRSSAINTCSPVWVTRSVNRPNGTNSCRPMAEFMCFRAPADSVPGGGPTVHHRSCATRNGGNQSFVPNNCRWISYGAPVAETGADGITRRVPPPTTGPGAIVDKHPGNCRQTTFKWTINGATATNVVPPNPNAAIKDGDQCFTLGATTTCIAQSSAWLVYDNCSCVTVDSATSCNGAVWPGDNGVSPTPVPLPTSVWADATCPYPP